MPPETLDELQLMGEGGEYGELALELAATLARTRAAVTAVEQQELRALLEATRMSTCPAGQLAVHG